MIHLKSLLPKLINPILNKSGLAQATLILDWDKIVGKKLSQYTLPLKASYPKNAREGGTIYVLVHPAWALLVQQSEQIIIEQINTFYGYKAIERLRLKQGYLPERFLPIKNPDTSSENEEESFKDLPPLTSDDQLNHALRRLEKVLMSQN